MKKTKLRMKCKACGYWNRIEVKKLFIEQPSSELKVKAIIPMYEPLKIEICKKYKSVIAEPKELIRITNPTVVKTIMLFIISLILWFF